MTTVQRVEWKVTLKPQKQLSELTYQRSLVGSETRCSHICYWNIWVNTLWWEVNFVEAVWVCYVFEQNAFKKCLIVTNTSLSNQAARPCSRSLTCFAAVRATLTLIWLQMKYHQFSNSKKKEHNSIKYFNHSKHVKGKIKQSHDLGQHAKRAIY